MAEKGTKENPYTSLEELKKSNAYYAGKKAVSEVEKRLGRKLSPTEKKIVEREGFVDAYYYDTRKKLTRGVGQTGDYAAGDTSLSGFDKATAMAKKAAKEQADQMRARGIAVNPNFEESLTGVNFQLGSGWTQKFPTAWENLLNKKYNEAISEIEFADPTNKPGVKSNWAKQSPTRVNDFTNAIQAQAKYVPQETPEQIIERRMIERGNTPINPFQGLGGLNSNYYPMWDYPMFKKGGEVNKMTTPMIDVSTDRLPYDRLQEMARRSMMQGNYQDRMDDYDYAREQAQRPYVNRYPVDAQGRGAYSTAAPMGMQAQRMMGFADGGPVDNAQGLASLGRGGDSMLVHMQPQEVAGLQRLAEQSGTSLTKNPYTGMPEAFSLGGVLKAAIPVAAGYFAGPAGAGLVSGMGGAMGVGALTGAAIAAASGDNPIMGAVSGGMGGASGFGLGEALGAGAASIGPGGWDPATGAVQSLSNQQALNMTTAGQAGAIANAPPVNAPNFNATVINKTPRSLGFSDFYNNPGKAFEQTQVNLGKNVPTGGFNPKTGDPRTIFQPATKLQAAMKLGSPVGSALMGGIEESDLAPDTGYLDDARARDKYDPTKRLNLNMDTGISEALKRDSGLRLLAQGGYLDGGRIGDGMSDSVHANIDGQQEARLSEGEFVVPADVVSHLGNGSSDAGAKRLYDMMDKIRQARTGTKQQGRQIDPRKYMPR